MELVCQRCRAVLTGSTEQSTKTRARVRGWRIFDGVTLTGEPLVVRLCAVCCKTPMVLRAPVLEGQEPLWGDDESQPGNES